MKTRTRLCFLNIPQALYVYIVVHINGRKISKSCRNTNHPNPPILSLLHLILSVSRYEGVCFMSSGDDFQRHSLIWTMDFWF